MQLNGVIVGDKFTVVKIILVVDEVLDYGKIKLTERWKAASVSLAKGLDIDGKLVQIDAGYEDVNKYYQRTQEFTFYFGD